MFFHSCVYNTIILSPSPAFTNIFLPPSLVTRRRSIKLLSTAITRRLCIINHRCEIPTIASVKRN
jgi:hypothetical protein